MKVLAYTSGTRVPAEAHKIYLTLKIILNNRIISFPRFSLFVSIPLLYTECCYQYFLLFTIQYYIYYLFIYHYSEYFLMLCSAMVVITVCSSWLVVFTSGMRSVTWHINGCISDCLQNGCARKISFLP